MINYYYKKTKTKTHPHPGWMFLSTKGRAKGSYEYHPGVQEYELVQYGGGNTCCKTKNRVAVQMSGVKFWHIG